MKKNPTSQIKAYNPVTYWVTRDADVGGVLSSHVDVWWERPSRESVTADGAVAWYDSTPTRIGMRYARVEAVHALAWGHTIPETSRECIRVETMGLAE